MDKNNNLFKFIICIYLIIIGYIIYNNYNNESYNNDVLLSLDYNINDNKYIVDHSNDDEFKNIVFNI